MDYLKNVFCKDHSVSHDIVCTSLNDRKYCTETDTIVRLCVPLINDDYLDAYYRLTEIVKGLKKE